MLCNLARIKPKVRPSEKEKRRKPLIELRDEANKKRKKKAAKLKKKREVATKPKRPARPKKCPYCGNEGHMVKECEYIALAKQMNAMKEVGVVFKL
jgi:hypothetical protein